MDLPSNILHRIGDLPAFFIPFAVLAASIIGSIHCIGMCGALALAASAHSKSGMFLYHAGRFVGYFSVGSLAGLFGAGFLRSELKYVPFVSGIILGISFLYVGFKIIRTGRFTARPPKILDRFYQKRIAKILQTKTSPKITGFLIGLLSPLLPCGWLYGFLLIAISTNSPLWGGVLLASFWLGTVPALSGFSFLARKPIAWYNGKAKVFFGVFLILIGISSIVWKLSNGTAPSCH